MGYMVFAAPIYDYTLKTAQQIQNNALYEDLLLKKDEQGEVMLVFNLMILKIYLKPSMAVNQQDPNAHLIPVLISPETLKGEHLSEYKQRQILEQDAEEQQPDDTQLKPMEAP